MGFIAGVQCDKCGVAQVWSWNAGKKYITIWAREEGWKIGKFVTCPKCAKEKRLKD